MMMQCWEFERKNRPTFSDLSDFLNRHYKRLASNSFQRSTKHEATMPKKCQDLDFDPGYVYKPIQLGSRKPSLSPGAGYTETPEVDYNPQQGSAQRPPAPQSFKIYQPAQMGKLKYDESNRIGL